MFFGDRRMFMVVQYIILPVGCVGYAAVHVKSFVNKGL